MFRSVQDRPGRGRKRSARSEENDEKIVNLISTDMYASLNYITRYTNISKSRVMRVLQENEMTSYKVGDMSRNYLRLMMMTSV